MSAFTSSHRNFALPSFVLLALAAFTMTVCAIEQSETIHRRLATTLADAPSLRLHFTLKRSSMNLYGQSQFYVFANPVVSSDNTSVIYDGYATFLDGTTEYTYMLVNGIAYSVVSTVGNASSLTAQCLPSILLPPVNNIISALSNATTVSSAFAGNDTITCASGILLQATLGDTTFVICSSGPDGFTVYGSDLDITVDYLTSPATITAPNLSDEAALSCETFVTPSPVSQTALTLLTGQAIPSSFRRNLKAASTTTLASSSCGCKSTPRPCVFFHGLGGKSEATTLQTKSRYFGDLSKNAPCCSSFQYAKLNTVDSPWTDATLQQKVCNFALSVSNTSSLSSRVVADTIIVTHSMGGLMMAGALANGQCSFASSTTWVSLSAPMGGSMGSDYLQNACSGKNVFIRAVANLIGKCPINKATLGLAYQNGIYSTPDLNAAFDAAQSAFRSNVKAVMCSKSYSGLLSADRAVYKLGGTFINHKSKQSDGIVEYASCTGGLPISSFGTNYNNTFYVTGLNHADTTFRHGDALFMNSHKPVKWFECLL
ncbi:RxLR-like protein [Plasmopara halstedii]|uniref:RxLR-like protein n=1 Tax=Plasmopara halstedii TaxID=4781 RepID=A0A0P1ALQ3_PLAHL|nr:RxLR-like protein [Plasmopara halstedii]CEG41665.1 RxLR-like protein [Plasmopara halstedii]|eukprot:XP_024578034.1 RxLR-like protein [Plasmopara halstedii]